MLDRYDDALAAFREGIEHNPKDAVSWNGLGDVYHKLGRFEDAIAAYQLGNVFEKQDLDKDVLKEYEKSIEPSRKNPETWNEAGNIYYHTGAYEDAIASYRKAIELDPADATFQANLAKAKQALEQANNQNEPAIAKTGSSMPEDKMAVPSEPDRDEIIEGESISEKLSSLANSTASRRSEAPYWVFTTEPVAEYSTVAAGTETNSSKAATSNSRRSHNKPASPVGSKRPCTEPETTALMVQLTPRSAKPGNTEDSSQPAVAKNDWVCASAETDVEAHKPSACTAQAGALSPDLPAVVPGNQEPDQAPINFHVLENDIAAYRKITEINPRNDRAWDAMGNMYEAAGLHSEAISAFEQAIALAPRKETYHFHLGIALAYQMHYDKAIEALQNSIAMNPNFVLGHCALAANYRRVGNEAEAQEHIAIARPSMEYEKEYNRACFESISGNTDQAFALLETALEKDQVQTAMLRSDPDLDFIRNDARFETVIYKSMTVSQ
jgi:tetratricopeptide (TPR) repeat protein